MSTVRGGHQQRGPRHQPTTHTTDLHDYTTAGAALQHALDHGYQPSLSDIPYFTPPSGCCTTARNAWISQATYAIAPDFLINQLAPHHDPPPRTPQPAPHAAHAAHAAHAIVAALQHPTSALAVPVRSSWTHAMRILTAQEPRMRISLHLATLGNPYPLIARYNEAQPYARLDRRSP